MIETISYTNLPEFELLTPNSLTEALDFLNKHQTNCKLLAGGTDLLVELRHRLIQPTVIIDVKNIPELKKLEFNESGLRIGAAVPISEILSQPQVKSKYYALYQALGDMCDEILRQRATIGGNIATSSPAADSAGPLGVHQANVEIKSKTGGTRLIHIQDFFTGVKKNCLTPDELIVAINLPLPSETARSAFIKMKRGAEDLALVGVTGFHDNKSMYLAFTAVAPTPIFLNISESIAPNSTKIGENEFQTIWEKIRSKITPITDVRSNREYRLHITEILTRMIIKEII